MIVAMEPMRRTANILLVRMGNLPVLTLGVFQNLSCVTESTIVKITKPQTKVTKTARITELVAVI